jgi:hypothetical protein
MAARTPPGAIKVISAAVAQFAVPARAAAAIEQIKRFLMVLLPLADRFSCVT